MEKSIKNFHWDGFGFPVVFSELPAVKINGELVPNVNWKKLRTLVLMEICSSQEAPLTGQQVQFIRKHFEMNLREFAKWVGVSHSIVIEWEKKGASPAKIESHTELVLRLYAIRKCDPDKTTDSYPLLATFENIALDVLKRREKAGEFPMSLQRPKEFALSK